VASRDLFREFAGLNTRHVQAKLSRADDLDEDAAHRRSLDCLA